MGHCTHTKVAFSTKIGKKVSYAAREEKGGKREKKYENSQLQDITYSHHPV